MNTPVNTTIEITAWGFSRRPRANALESFPRRMVWDDREYTFAENGMRFLVRKGQELIRLFDVSDDQHSYRLKCDDQDHWTLVSVGAPA